MSNEENICVSCNGRFHLSTEMKKDKVRMFLREAEENIQTFTRVNCVI